MTGTSHAAVSGMDTDNPTPSLAPMPGTEELAAAHAAAKTAADGRLVFVYWNLHRRCWSLMDRRSRRVIAHAEELTLRPATFVVSEAGRQRVLRTGRKTVHAGVVGVCVANQGAERGVPVRYNPRTGATFTRRDTGATVRAAAAVHFSTERPAEGRPTPVVRAVEPK